MLATHGVWVKKETLAVTLELARIGGEPAAGAYREELKVNGLPVTVELAKA